MCSFATVYKFFIDIIMEIRNEYKVSKPVLFENGAIAIAEKIDDFDSQSIVHIDGVMIVLCCQGKVSVDINSQTYTAQTNDLVICLPEVIIENGKISDDFKFKAIFMSVDYAFNMLPTSVRNWNFKMFFEQNPNIHLPKVKCRYSTATSNCSRTSLPTRPTHTAST